MLGSIVVAIDLQRAEERALPIAQALGKRAGLPVEIVTVASAGVPEIRPELELGRWARDHGLDPRSILVLHGDDPARAVAAQVNHRQGDLLVMSTAARSAVGLPVAGSVSEGVLAHVCQPVLLVGPNVEQPCPMASTTLVVCVDGSDHAEAALPVVVAWTSTFGGRPPWFVEVVPSLPAWATVPDEVDAAHVRRFAERLAGHGVSASGKVLRGGDPVARLCEFADQIPESVLAVTSERWPGSSHWHSTARKLVRWSRRPVLVVPADRPGLAQPDPIVSGRERQARGG